MVLCEDCEDAPATQTREDEEGNPVELCDDCADDYDEQQEEDEDGDDPY